MSTVLYLSPALDAPAGVAPASPAGVNGDPVARRTMPSAQDGAAATDFARPGSKSAAKYAVAQWISEPLNAQTIGGTVTGGIRSRYSSGEASLVGTVYLGLVLRVMSGDGTVERGTLLAYTRDDVALLTTSKRRLHPNAGTALAAVACQPGDVIVADVCNEMTVASPTNVNHYLTASTVGDRITGDDAGGFACFLEFSQDLSFQTPVAPPTVEITSPTASAVSVPEGTKLRLEFTATNAFDEDLSADAQIASSNSADGSLGALGNGSPFVLDTTGMADGDRTITVTVIDPNSQLSGSDSFLLTIGTPAPSGVTSTPGADFMLISKGETDAASRTVPLFLRNADGTPYATAITDGAVAWLGNTQATNALVAEDAPNGDYTLELTAAEVASVGAFRVKVAGKGDGVLVQVVAGAAVSASGGVPVSGYEAGQDPATLLLVTPANKLATNAAGEAASTLSAAERTGIWSIAGLFDGISPLTYFRRMAAFYFGKGTDLNTANPKFAALNNDAKIRVTGAVGAATRTPSFDDS